MNHLLIDEYASIRITTKTLMLEGSLVLLIDEGTTLIMPHYVGEIGLKLMVLAPV